METLKERGSVDTFLVRLGVEGRPPEQSAPRRPRAPLDRDQTRSSLSAQRPEQYNLPERRKAERAERPRKKSSFWSTLCCMGGSGDNDNYVEVVRHKRRKDGARWPDTPPQGRLDRPSGISRPSFQPNEPSRTSNATRRPRSNPPTRPSPQHVSSTASQTTSLLALIPKDLSPQTTSTLLSELSKPPNPLDEEGYIYIFWLTPSTTTTPPESTARDLLSTPARPSQGRRISDVLSAYSDAGDTPTSENMVLLKIGRANNVYRRMTEWQRQCGYALTLLRWYPHVPSSSHPSSPAASPPPSASRMPPNRQSPQPQLYPDLSRPIPRRDSSAVRKVPQVKKVERLVHLELADRQVKQKCTVCGRDHKEWFSIAATEKGVRGVDEVVRRWVGWAEDQGQDQRQEVYA
ncbi:hypothetical protein B0A48_10138 [Cryoendolithus antarcticus]|uniref:Bacteriophage T5 Orf172 DNA-binding domain-containing protein n=1 Tax=Cryoendolithus antarcticus TaxID=1507870 RepID=A0A1V8SWN1_9PEZI|nr:hypothetical protein B0A48_10138 [Cryoendolithus antarcticus]